MTGLPVKKSPSVTAPSSFVEEARRQRQQSPRMWLKCKSREIVLRVCQCAVARYGSRDDDQHKRGSNLSHGCLFGKPVNPLSSQLLHHLLDRDMDDPFLLIDPVVIIEAIFLVEAEGHQILLGIDLQFRRRRSNLKPAADIRYRSGVGPHQYQWCNNQKNKRAQINKSHWLERPVLVLVFSMRVILPDLTYLSHGSRPSTSAIRRGLTVGRSAAPTRTAAPSVHPKQRLLRHRARTGRDEQTPAAPATICRRAG